MRLTVHADGASWGNPGHSAIGAVIKDERGKELAKISQYIGRGTNNQAEYKAAIAGLRAAASFKASEVILYLDSELVVRQLNGQYKVKSALLRPLYAEAARLAAEFENLSINHVGRDSNPDAHTLADEALKKLTAQTT